MMKKLRLLVLLIILTFSFSVKAMVLIDVDCNSKEITDNKSVKCEVDLYYETEGINDIELNYQTNLDITFNDVSGFTMTNNNGKVLIHSDNTLYDQNMNAAKILEFNLSSKANSNEKESLAISNIVINNSNEIKVDGQNIDFKVIRETSKLDDICTLDSITVENEKVKNFDKNKLEYRGITVTNEVIFIDAVRTSLKSSATGLGNVRVPNGETIERNITVTAEDGTTKIYKLFITNTSSKIDMEDEVKPDEVPRSSDNSLKTMEIYQDDKKLDIEFDNQKDTYNIEINDEVVKKLTIKATLNDPKAEFIKNYGPRDIKLVFGYHQEYLKIKAENNEEKVITININYLDNREKDNTLESLKINGQLVDLTSDKLEVKLPSTTKKTIIEAVATSEKATITFEDIDLILGDNEVKIEVTSEDGETKEYDVNVLVEDSKIIFDNIKVVGYNIDFQKDKKIYDLKINNDVESLDIIVNPNTVKYNILNNKDLKDQDKITILITDDLGSYEYTINIQKDGVLPDMVCYLIFGIGVVSLIGSIIYYMKKKK